MMRQARMGDVVCTTDLASLDAFLDDVMSFKEATFKLVKTAALNLKF